MGIRAPAGPPKHLSGRQYRELSDIQKLNIYYVKRNRVEERGDGHEVHHWEGGAGGGQGRDTGSIWPLGVGGQCPHL